MRKIKRSMTIMMLILCAFLLACKKEEIKLFGNQQMEVGSSQRITFTNYEQYNDVKWSVSDDTIASYEADGSTIILYALKKGEVTVSLELNSKSYLLNISVIESVPSVTITGANSVTVDETITLTAEANSVVTWEASNNNVVIVPNDNTVTVKGVSAGDVIIKATLAGYTSEFKLSVKEKDVLLSITGSNQLFVGKTTLLTANIEGAIFTSSNEDVATVDNGLVTAKAAGKANIIAKYNNQESVFEITVYDSSVVSITGTNQGYVNEQYTYQVDEQFTDVSWAAEGLTLTANKNQVTVVANAAGNYVLKATIFNQEFTFQVEFINRENIVITGTNEMFVNQQNTLTVNSPYLATDMLWVSDDDTVLTVENGVVTAINEGTANITATLKTNPNISSTFTIKVLADDAYKLNCKTELEAGEITYIEVITSGVVQKLEWSIDKTDLAIIRDGTLLPLKPGKLIVSAISQSNYVATIEITIVQKATVEVDAAKLAYVEEKMKSMTIEQKIGQMFIIGFWGMSIPNDVVQAIEQYKFGNVIFMQYNTTEPYATKELVNNLQSLIIQNTGVPAIVSIDQEGGKVVKITNGATHFVGNMTVGATKNYNNSYLIGSASGQQLRHYGISTAYAPVVDVNNNPNNPIIGIRSYGDDPLDVALFGTNMIKGLKESNVLSCVKHFPGHGNTSTDTHLAMPSITSTKDELYKIELAPYIAAIQSGVDAIMTTHIVFNAFDTLYPATLSTKVLKNLLRDELNYQGLIFTDGMDMDAIKNNFGYAQAGRLAVNASVDILTFTAIANAITAYNGILDGYRLGSVKLATIDEAVKRILLTKLNYDLFDNYQPALGEIDNTEAEKLNETIAQSAITLATGSFTGLDKAKSTLFISTSTTRYPLAPGLSGDNNSFAFVANNKLSSLGYTTNYRVVGTNPSNNTISQLVALAENYDQIVFALDSVKSSNRTQLASLVNQIASIANKQVVAISLDTPYDGQMYMGLDAYICGYEYTPIMTNTLIDYLQGKFTATGKLPIQSK